MKRAPTSAASNGIESDGIDQAILELIRHPYLAETLAALDGQPHTLASLRHTGVPRRAAIAALRALAAHRAITREPATGTWDTSGDNVVRYQLTPAGHALVGQLWNLDVWRALYG
jgi:hypothetical protein